MESGVQLPTMVQFRSAGAETAVRPRQFVEEPAFIPTLEGKPVPRKSNALRSVLLGLAFTMLQIFVAVVLIAPEGPLRYRYETLVQHDSYWFANIIERGYNTILPPIQHKMMEVSNVAFFPAFPSIAGALHHATGLPIYVSLLITAQVAAWGFWTYFFLLAARWELSRLAQAAGAVAVLAHPTAFFLIAGYSESLFLCALLGFIYWTGAEGRTAKVLAAAHGFVMSATRIVGIPCALYPAMRALFEGGFEQLRDVRGWFRHYAGPAILSLVAMLGALGFFLYCQLRWGHWDVYMLTQQAGWDIRPDYLAVFKLESYRWLLPPLDDPTQWSQMTMTVGGLLFVAVALCELLPALRLRTQWQTRIGFYAVAFITYYIAVSGVASVQMESMLRYQFCAHVLIVLAFMHFFAHLPAPSVRWRAIGLAVLGLLCTAGLGLQGWWVWNFTRGDWVA
ncbi:MAG: hypothetical protein M3032_06365 [Verrucomicrobiota bacterium]|nr:hypothetical protein [Verrucomicrobiota bacterium]